jgi:hypothetical protein
MDHEVTLDHVLGADSEAEYKYPKLPSVWISTAYNLPFWRMSAADAFMADGADDDSTVAYVSSHVVPSYRPKYVVNVAWFEACCVWR